MTALTVLHVKMNNFSNAIMINYLLNKVFIQLKRHQLVFNVLVLKLSAYLVIKKKIVKMDMKGFYAMNVKQDIIGILEMINVKFAIKFNLNS